VELEYGVNQLNLLAMSLMIPNGLRISRSHSKSCVRDFRGN